MKIQKMYKLYLLDMDGTIYFEDQLIDGALEFIKKLKFENIPYVFISNNSSVSKDYYLNKLKKIGIPCSDENIFSSSIAMALYLKENYSDKKIYCLGTNLFKLELRNYGINLVEDESAEVLVVGYDRELNYEKLEKACHILFNGGIFLATNPDLVYPLKNNRYVPDCGSICNMLEVATKRKPLYIGKPNPYMIECIKKMYNVKDDEIVVIGDRLYTDIELARNANVNSILVLSGETTKEMLASSFINPTYVINSIKDLI